jgi:cytochrome c-type biogenesis protein
VNAVVLPFVAVAAGIISASSPCVLPVIPGFLAAVSPDSGASTSADWHPSRRGAVGFVAGFTVVFTMLGATASVVGNALYSHLDVALKVAGIALVLFGAATAGLLRLPMINRERRMIPLDRFAGGPRRAFLLGVAFALGWTPCIGPVLATILTKAAADATLLQGVILLLLYSLGLGIPFLIVALWFERTRRPRAWIGRHAWTLQRIAGVVMILAGIGYITGAWAGLFTGVQRWLARTGWPPI